MKWTFESAQEAFDLYRDLWDDINARRGNHVLLDSTFVALLVHYFAKRETLLAVSKDADNPGLALVEKSRTGFWHTFQPSQAPLGLFLLKSPEGAVRQTQSLIRSLPGYALGFAVQQQDPDFTVFRDLTCDSNRVETVDYIRTARLRIEGGFDDYWRSRGRDLGDNLARRYRNLAKKGIQSQFAVDRDPNRVEMCIREYARLEGSGWKASEGTAVTAENVQGMFYRQLLENSCRKMEGVVYRLLFDGKTVASQLGLERDGMLVLLKTSYDEAAKSFSPGFLLQYEIFKHEFGEGRIRVVEFYGRVREGWTTKWSDDIRSMRHINFYRHSWVPSARRLLKSGLNRFQSERKLAANASEDA